MAMNNYVYLTMIIILLFSCKQKPTKQNFDEITNVSVPTFLIYGELVPNGYVKEKDSSVTQQFGFNIKRVAGCEVTNKLVARVKENNEKNNLIMRSKYGTNWKQKFETAAKLKLAIPEIE